MIPPGIGEAIVEYLLEHFDHKEIATLETKLKSAAAAAAEIADPSTLRFRCPMLGEDGLCTIYEVRPPACRAFSSQSVSACKALVFNPDGEISSISQNPLQFRPYLEATAALERIAFALGKPHNQTSLVVELLKLLQTRHIT